MNPEEFLEEYLSWDKSVPGTTEAAARLTDLPRLEEKHFFNTSEPYRYMDHFVIDYLTRDELLKLLKDLNIDHIENPSPGQMRASVHGRLEVIDALNRRLVEQERVIAAQALQVEALNRIYERRAYRFYRVAVKCYRAIRRIPRSIVQAGNHKP